MTTTSSNFELYQKLKAASNLTEEELQELRTRLNISPYSELESSIESFSESRMLDAAIILLHAANKENSDLNIEIEDEGLAEWVEMIGLNELDDSDKLRAIITRLPIKKLRQRKKNKKEELTAPVITDTTQAVKTEEVCPL